MAHATVTSELEFMRARACVARRQVTLGQVDPEDALAFVVWPTREIREAEEAAPRNTIAFRAVSLRLNP